MSHDRLDVFHWSDQDIMDIIWGFDATDGHPAGAGYPWGWQGSFFCADCQKCIGIADLDEGGRHPACGELIVHQIDRMLRIGRKIRERRSET